MVAVEQFVIVYFFSGFGVLFRLFLICNTHNYLRHDIVFKHVDFLQ